MAIKEKLPVSYLLFSRRGRINRMTYWTASLFIWTTFYVLFTAIEYSISYSATWIIYPLLYWALYCTANKRLHDIGLSGYWLFLLLIPVFGPLAIFILLGFWRGSKNTNKFGTNPNLKNDYFKNTEAETIKHLKTNERITNDVSRLNPVLVSEVMKPKSVDELTEIIKSNKGPISIAGGRFSMGGQTAVPHGIQIDLSSFNSIIDFSPENKTIKVEAGIRWCDIQKHIDGFDLSVKIMQSYANFTVGGSLSVNCHGRYVGLGPVIISVRSVDLILASGELIHASRTENKELFSASIGCYNAVAIIAAVELDLVSNQTIEKHQQVVSVKDYKAFFKKNIVEEKKTVLHNGDLYPPDFKRVRAVSWIESSRKPTKKSRLLPLAASYPLERYFISAFSKSNFAKWRRQYIYDPIFHFRKKVHWRNYEAGYDVAELEPNSREYSSYILQEYFIPIDELETYTAAIAEIFKRYDINVINISIRHSIENQESLLSWSNQEVFAFVIWYKQGTSEAAKNKVGVWTRELIDVTLKAKGTYYLPYQIHATNEQFHKAYPKAKELFKLKQELDPNYKFRNALWETYYKSSFNQTPADEFRI